MLVTLLKQYKYTENMIQLFCCNVKMICMDYYGFFPGNAFIYAIPTKKLSNNIQNAD